MLVLCVFINDVVFRLKEHVQYTSVVQPNKVYSHYITCHIVIVCVNERRAIQLVLCKVKISMVIALASDIRVTIIKEDTRGYKTYGNSLEKRLPGRSLFATGLCLR